MPEDSASFRPVEGPMVDWKAGEGTTVVTEAALAQTEAGTMVDAIDSLEKLVGRNNLRGVSHFEAAIKRARSVAFIQVPGVGVATGFMISNDRLLTNHHVFPSAKLAAGAKIRFNYQKSLSGRMLKTTDYETSPETFFHNNKALDYAVVHVDGRPGAKWGFIPTVSHLTVEVKEDVAIIQHPAGEPKQVAIADNEIEYVDERVAQYLTDTMPGSSGSPVFNNDWEVVALHHSGGWLPEPSTTSTHFRNEGILISAILADLPDLAG